jgi:hypothetical protein
MKHVPEAMVIAVAQVSIGFPDFFRGPQIYTIYLSIAIVDKCCVIDIVIVG